MKKIAILSALVVLLASSCEFRPEADFYVTSPVVDVYEDVYFANTSSHADYYKWNFGDGNVSSLPNPSHYYELPGSYTVTLEAYQGSKEIDQASMIIDVLSTSLDIEVLEYLDKYPVPEASIVLYTTQYDWDNQINRLFGENGEWFTDANGFAIIHGLNPIIYYVDIWHPSHNNYLLAEEDMNNVKTLPLSRHQVNQYTFYVDYVGTISRKDGRQVAQYKIVKIERKTPGNQTR